MGVQQVATEVFEILDGVTAGLPQPTRPPVVIPPVLWVEPPAVQATNLVIWQVSVTVIAIAAGDDADQIELVYEWADTVTLALVDGGWAVDASPYNAGDLNGAPSTALAYAWVATKNVKPPVGGPL